MLWQWEPAGENSGRAAVDVTSSGSSPSKDAVHEIPVSLLRLRFSPVDDVANESNLVKPDHVDHHKIVGDRQIPKTIRTNDQERNCIAWNMSGRIPIGVAPLWFSGV